jgi:hypothetical protein
LTKDFFGTLESSHDILLTLPITHSECCSTVPGRAPGRASRTDTDRDFLGYRDKYKPT